MEHQCISDALMTTWWPMLRTPPLQNLPLHIGQIDLSTLSTPLDILDKFCQLCPNETKFAYANFVSEPVGLHMVLSTLSNLSTWDRICLGILNKFCPLCPLCTICLANWTNGFVTFVQTPFAWDRICYGICSICSICTICPWGVDKLDKLYNLYNLRCPETEFA